MTAMSAANADAKLTADLDIGGTGAYVQLHTGSPGVDGTANLAAYDSGDAPRKLVEWAAPSNHPSNTERRSLSTSEAEWAGDGVDLDLGEDLTHFSIWSAVSGGNFRYAAALTTPKTTGSDGARFAIGSLECAIGVFAKPE